jgi:hypothetical protein
MRGFLDPTYLSRVGYRNIIDGLIVRLNPNQAFGFGNTVEPIPASLESLGNRDFYDDSNTELEDALEVIARDSTTASTHLVIGDGRRTDPDLANGQYVAMRQLARDWIERGGTFLVAASRAPFATVEGDPAGCRPDPEAAAATCPLYAFMFIAAGDETRIVGTFATADVFEHVFVWPLPATDQTRLTATESHPDLTFESSWAATPNGTPIARVRGNAYTNDPLGGQLELGPASDLAGAATRLALEGQAFTNSISVRLLNDPSGAAPWQPVLGRISLVTAVQGEPRAFEVRSLGSPDRNLYRIEVLPTGEVPWLSEFDAASAGDAERTLGLGRLFELFRSLAQADSPSPVQRAYLVVN